MSAPQALGRQHNQFGILIEPVSVVLRTQVWREVANFAALSLEWAFYVQSELWGFPFLKKVLVQG